MKFTIFSDIYCEVMDDLQVMDPGVPKKERCIFTVIDETNVKVQVVLWKQFVG
jgi:hypothetical protein